jgi:glucosamine--fructose-6-phosphate aminotransferase (isomerizing)
VNKVINSYISECQEQPERLAAICRHYQEDDRICRQIAQFKQANLQDGTVVWIGMGASYCAGISGATRLCSSGRLSFAAEASEWLHYCDRVPNPDTLPIFVTNSGESAELVRLCDRASGAAVEQQRPTVFLCNDEQSSCWSNAQIRFPIMAGTEHANATKSFVNSTAACIILASELTGREWKSEAQIVIESFSNSLTRLFDRRAELEEFCHDTASIEVVGRGAAVGGALMGALCIREMSGIRAGAHSGGAFRHGPLLDVDGTHLSIILALGKTADLGLTLADDCVTRGGNVILIGTRERARCGRLLTMKVDTVPDGWEAITSVLVSQTLTSALIERNGSRYVHVCTTTE